MAHHQTRSRQKNRKKSRYSTRKKSNVKKRAYRRRKPNTTRYVNRAHQCAQSASTSSLSVDCSESACSVCRREQNQGCDDPGNKHNGGSASESQSGSFRDSMPASRKQSPEASP